MDMENIYAHMKRLLPWFFIIGISVVAIRPIFFSGYFPMHDDTQVARVITMGNALKEGQFPVRLVSGLGYGYGYPIFNFYGPLPYYFGGILYALGVSALLATKLMFAVGIILPAILLFGVLSGRLGIPAALVSSLLYLFGPYHAVQIYVRGAVGEYWILMFWPLILYAFARSTRLHAYGGVLIGAIGITGAVLSHTLLGFVTVLFLWAGLFVYWLVRIVNRKFDTQVFLSHMSMMILGLGLSAFFWLPAIREMGSTSVAGQISETANYRDHFVCVGQLWSSLWGYGGSAAGCLDGMSFILGKLHIILAFASVFGWLWKKPKNIKPLVIAGVAISSLSVFFMTAPSSYIWAMIPGFSYLQYPWRFLALSLFGLSLLGGVVVSLLPSVRKQAAAAAILGILVVSLNAKWFVPQYTYVIQSTAFETPMDLRWRASKISDEYLPRDVIRPAKDTEAIFDTIRSGNGLTVTILQESAVETRMVLESTGSAEVTVHKAYFPGWRYFINNNEVTPKIDNGLPRIHVGAGQSLFEMRFTDTPVRSVGNGISFAVLILIAVICYEKQRKAKR